MSISNNINTNRDFNALESTLQKRNTKLIAIYMKTIKKASSIHREQFHLAV